MPLSEVMAVASRGKWHGRVHKLRSLRTNLDIGICFVLPHNKFLSNVSGRPWPMAVGLHLAS